MTHGSIEKRNGKFRARFRRQGFRERSATFTTREDAVRWLRDAAVRADRAAAGIVVPGDVLVRELILRWLEEGELAKLSPTERPSRSGILSWWLGVAGELSPAALPEELRRIRREFLSSGRSGATWNRRLSALSAVLSAATDDGLLHENPLRRVRLRQPEKASHEARDDARFLSTDEQQRLLQAVRAEGNLDLEALVLLALTTGARAGSLLALTRDDVDLEHGIVVFRRTKSGRQYSAPLGNEAKEVLLRLLEQRQETRFFHARFPEEAWDRARLRSGLCPPRLRFHDLRHTFGYLLARSGANQVTIMRAMDHSTFAASARYMHLAPTDVHDAVRAALSSQSSTATSAAPVSTTSTGALP